MSNYNKMPCFRFYGGAEDDRERLKRMEYALLNMLKRSGVTDVNMATMEVYRSINPILSGTVDTIECEHVFQEADPKSEFACAMYWKEELGIDVHVSHGDFCRVCPVSEEGGRNRFQVEQERHIISYLCHTPVEKIASFFRGENPFCSYEELNRHFNGKMKFPCVIQLASIIYQSLATEESLYRKICGSIGNEKLLARAASELSERVLGVVAGLYPDKDTTVLQSEAFREILASYIREFYILCEQASDTQVDMFCTMMCSSADEPEDILPKRDVLDIGDVPASDDKEEYEERPACEGFEEERTGNAGEKDGLVPVQERYGSLEEHPYFVKKVPIGEGGWLGHHEPVEFVPAAQRRYLIPFLQNDAEEAISRRNVIVHQELQAGDLEGMIDVSDAEEEKVFQELRFLSDKVRRDRRMAVEAVYVADEGRYILLIWNAATARYNYTTLIEKTDGLIRAIPMQIIRLLRMEDIKIMCYQSYMLCGILSLYFKEIEIKNLHSVYSHYCVFSRKDGGGNAQMADIIQQYLIGLNEKDRKLAAITNKRFGNRAFLLWQMPLYDMILRQQFAYAKMMGMEGLCASQQKKDIMYGYSYLAAGIYPSMQKARFSLSSNGEIVFVEEAEPAVSYEPGYIVEYTFKNINYDGSDEAVAQQVRSNHRARQLLLKELAQKSPAFYHSHLKILYFDDYRITFYMSHDYRDDNQTLIEQSLYRECTRYRVSSNKLTASYWATTFNAVRKINRH